MTKKTEVTTGQVQEACRALGLDPSEVVEVTLSATQVRVTEFHRLPDGTLPINGDGSGFRKKYRILPVKWGKA